MRKIIVAVAFAGAMTPLHAQSQYPFERLLAPIFLSEPLAGAYGSIWTTRLVGRNESDAVVDVGVGNPIGTCPQPPCGIRPGRSFSLTSGFQRVDPNGGAFVYVGSPGIGRVIFSLRVQDTSRQSQTYGTSLPVLRASDMYTTTLQLLEVPTDRRFRVALRVYDYDLPADHFARLRIFDATNDFNSIPFVDTVLHLQSPDFNSYEAVPGTAVFTDLVSAFPQLASVSLVRIQIEPVSADMRFWAFASVTNNETQHVTTIVPNK